MRLFIFFLSCFSATLLTAQDPVVWNASFVKTDKKIVFTAHLEDGWHLYSQFIDPSAGPVPTSFVIDASNDFSLDGVVTESEPIIAFDESFEAEVAYFEKEARFEQKINPFKEAIVTARVTYMVCNNITCLPPTESNFTINIHP